MGVDLGVVTLWGWRRRKQRLAVFVVVGSGTPRGRTHWHGMGFGGGGESGPFDGRGIPMFRREMGGRECMWGASGGRGGSRGVDM